MKTKLRPRGLACAVLITTFAMLSAGCSNLTGETGSSAKADSVSSVRATALRFSQCMRDNGVKEFPDPDSNGGLTLDGVVNGSSIDPESAAWKRAIAACKDLQPSGFAASKRSGQQQADALKFAQCIRDNGVKDFPDPDPNGPLIDTNRIPSANKAGGMTILDAAIHKCSDAVAEQVDGQR